jgi:hypothetical protein
MPYNINKKHDLKDATLFPCRSSPDNLFFIPNA